MDQEASANSGQREHCRNRSSSFGVEAAANLFTPELAELLTIYRGLRADRRTAFLPETWLAAARFDIVRAFA
jgi:hypothetical protein